MYRSWKNLDAESEPLVAQPYFDNGSGKAPRYYQTLAINRTIEAIAKGQDRVLLVMATGTGKTYTAFQIIWRLWKAGRKKRILFLADRNILIDQTKSNDFKPFGGAMTKIANRQADKSYEIYLSLYQAVTGTEEEQNIYKQFSPDFFDLIIIDECHRGSAAADSAWREILEYFGSATQIGLTATPRKLGKSRISITSASRFIPIRLSKASKTVSSPLTRSCGMISTVISPVIDPKRERWIVTVAKLKIGFTICGILTETSFLTNGQSWLRGKLQNS